MSKIIVFLAIWIVTDLTSPLPSVPEVRTITGTTDDPEARQLFERGLLLLHNFEYSDARDLFRKAQDEDAYFAMAYWGEAMTYNHPIWLSQDAEKARAVMTSYKKRSANAPRQLPELDADLLASLDLLYGEGSKAERDKAYAGYMKDLYQKYGSNHDIAAFYSLSLLGEAAGWNEALCNQAAVVAGKILKENADHPGALHYFIHAQDHPEFARLAWDQANAYSKVASYSGHALHMPSHIYLALGLWDDVVRSNEVSWQAGVDRKNAKKLDNNALNYHAHWWLEYGYLHQGRYSKAEELLKNQLTYTRALPSSTARNHFVIMRGHYAVESGDWQNAIMKEEIKTRDLRIEIRNLDLFVRGLAAFQSGNAAGLAAIAEEMERDINGARQIAKTNDGIAQCGGTAYGTSGVTQASILLEETKGLHAYLADDRPRAQEHFQRAVALEEQAGHFFGPPEILIPAHEFYAAFLLAVNKPSEAAQTFEKALQKTPGRNQSLHGLMRAAILAGGAAKEGQATATLKKNLASRESAIKGFFPPR